jgi:hypothetical protein
MKKILLIALVLFAAIGVFAQEKTIEKTEFDTVFKNSFRGLSKSPRRETRTSESSFEVIPQPNYPANSLASLQPTNITLMKTIIEFVPGIGSHMIYEFNSPSLYKKTETIIIAGKTYKREGDNEWREEPPVASTKSESTTKTVDNQFEYKFLGMEQFNNQNAHVYAVTETNKIISLKNNNEGLSSNITKYWFAAEDGRLLKTESKRKIRNEKTISTFNATVLYELDPNIKIEAPRIQS